MGIGPNALSQVYPQYRPAWGMETALPHNAYIDALVSGGVVLLLSFMFLAYRLFKTGNASDRVETPVEEPQIRPIVPMLHLFGMFIGVLMAGYLFRGLTAEETLRMRAGEAGAAVATGTIAYAAMLILAPLGAWWFAKRVIPAAGTLMPIAFTAGLLGMLVRSWVEFLWHSEALVVTVIALAWAVSAEQKKAQEPVSEAGDDMLSVWRLGPAALGMAFIGLAIVLECMLPFKGIMELNSAENVYAPKLMELGDDYLAMTYAEKLLKDGNVSEAVEFFKEHRFRTQFYAGPGAEKENREYLLKAVTAVKADLAQNINYGQGEIDSKLFAFVFRFEKNDSALMRTAVLYKNLAAGGVNTENNLEKAASLAGEALEISPSSASYNSLAGEIALSRERYDEAVRYFEEAVRLYPASPKNLLALGDAVMLAGDSFRSGDIYEEAMALNTGNIEEQTSLYTVAYYPNLLPQRRPAVENDFHAALDATIRVSSADVYDSLPTVPYLFRQGLHELAYGDAAEAADIFRLLANLREGRFAESMNVFLWEAETKVAKVKQSSPDYPKKPEASDDRSEFILNRIEAGFAPMRKGL